MLNNCKLKRYFRMNTIFKFVITNKMYLKFFILNLKQLDKIVNDNY